MLFYSTNQKTPPVTFREAVLKGLADDGGLFMPESFPVMSAGWIETLPKMTLPELSIEIAKRFVDGEIREEDLVEIISDAFYFDAPVRQLGETLFVLELFHGPTLAFKDFGARFMARMMSYFVAESNRELTVLVATSGDTGGAVADGFWNVDGIRVVLLYPRGKVSPIQEQQMTTLGGNISALEIEGSFDDCQKLVKQAFLDPDLNAKIQLTSANSINLSRLIPQSFYYFRGFGQLPDRTSPVIFSVPSGNFGNLAAGLFAKKLGLPVSKFVAATNVNNVVPSYLETGQFEPRPSVQTISNAMDVGNPSNFARILEIYSNDLERIRQDIYGCSFTDDQTRDGMRRLLDQYNYLTDPHGAIGYLGLEHAKLPGTGIFLETAHPAKFLDVVQPIARTKLEVPVTLKRILKRPKQSIHLPNNFAELKAFLLS
jgi:threonine synthase